jgi:hypothetical protein
MYVEGVDDWLLPDFFSVFFSFPKRSSKSSPRPSSDCFFAGVDAAETAATLSDLVVPEFDRDDEPVRSPRVPELGLVGVASLTAGGGEGVTAGAGVGVTATGVGAPPVAVATTGAVAGVVPGAGAGGVDGFATPGVAAGCAFTSVGTDGGGVGTSAGLAGCVTAATATGCCGGDSLKAKYPTTATSSTTTAAMLATMIILLFPPCGPGAADGG